MRHSMLGYMTGINSVQFEWPNSPDADHLRHLSPSEWVSASSPWHLPGSSVGDDPRLIGGHRHGDLNDPLMPDNPEYKDTGGRGDWYENEAWWREEYNLQLTRLFSETDCIEFTFGSVNQDEYVARYAPILASRPLYTLGSHTRSVK